MARKWAGQVHLHKQLLDSLKVIALRTPVKEMEEEWNWKASEEFWNWKFSDEREFRKVVFPSRRARITERNIKQNKEDRTKWSAARDWRRLDSCQKEFIGFKASCCNSRAVAVPIGCDCRLCPFCNAARLQRFREPARQMLAAMENPTFLTLTVPNQKHISRKLFNDLRRCWKEFYRLNGAHLRGGMYAIETTYNRERATWHPHLHCIFDASYPYHGMEKCENCRRLAKHGIRRGDFTIEDALRCECPFIIAKLLIEFSWLRITSREAKKEYRRNEFQR